MTAKTSKKIGQKPGEDHPLHKLTDKTVKELRARRARGERYKNLANAFGVSIGTAMKASTGITWSHIPGCQKKTW